MRLLKKLLRFAAVSGVGWLVDLAVYAVLTKVFLFSVLAANYLSSAVSVTFVFFVSTRHVLENRNKRIPTARKYLYYLTYQLILVTLVSLLATLIDRYLAAQPWVQSLPPLAENTKLAAKLLITPVTMVCNFFVLKLLTEGVRRNG